MDNGIRDFNGKVGVKNRMDIIEVLLTVCSTVAGLVAIAYTTFKLERRNKRRSLFRALYDEIKRNHSFIQNSEPTHLYTSSYQNIRIAGELFILSEEVRRVLEEVYELIDVYNHQRELFYLERTFEQAIHPGFSLSDNIPSVIGIENIAKKLKYLENELPKEKKLKFLD